MMKTIIKASICNVNFEFKKKGYVIIPDILPTQKEFHLFYKKFNGLIKRIRGNPEIASRLNEASEKWKLEEDNANYYCNAPAKYIDRTQREDKENKVYYQANWDFINFFCKHYYALYEDLPELYFIHNFFKSLHIIASINLKKIIKAMELDYPGISQRLIPKDRPLAIVCKVLKYNPAPDTFTTFPHCDKGAFSMIINNDDAQKDKFIVSTYPSDGIVKISHMKCPDIEKVAYNKKTSAIVIPDTTLQDVGFDISPSPHAVLPNTKERFATIAFMLVHSLGEVGKPIVQYKNDAF